jgi:nucleoside-diphosphate-sugar epimerase
MRVFVAGASGAVGRALVPLLVAERHEVTGMTRRPDRVAALESSGARAVVLDVFDAPGVLRAMEEARPDVVIHQLTNLGSIGPGGPFPDEVMAGNARLRDEGTANLLAAATAAGARRFVAQSIAWIYAAGTGPHVEHDPLVPDGPSATVTVRGVHALERQVLHAPLDGFVLRYGRFYGPGAWTQLPPDPPTVSVTAAARATALAATRGEPGVYNIVDDGGPVSNERARRELGWQPG